jgi:hypothetical protein
MQVDIPDEEEKTTEEGFNRALLYENKRRSMSVLQPSEQ